MAWIQQKYRKHLRTLAEISCLRSGRSDEESIKTALDLADQQWKRDVDAGGLDFFTEEVLGFNNAAHQREWYETLDDESYHFIGVAAPRGHTKSTCFSVNYPLQRIKKKPNVRMLLVSNAAPQAEGFLREIVNRIERDQSYVDYAGQLKPRQPEKWTNREIIIERTNLSMKDPTISTVGYGGTVLARRVDEIICDDLLSPENTRTVEARAKLRAFFYEVLLPILVPGGRVIFVGTVWHPQDLLLEILGDPTWDYRKKFQAIIKEPDKLEMWDEWYGMRMEGTRESKRRADGFLVEHKEEMHKGIKVLWPEMFSYEFLYTKRRSSRTAFEKAYQNNIVSREDQKFKEEWLARALDRGANYRLINTLTIDQRKEIKAMGGGIDLAAGENESADDNAMVTLGQRRLDDMIQLLSLDRGKFSPKEWRSVIAERSKDLRHDRILVESNAYQVAIKRDLEDENIPIVGYNTGGEKFDPYIGVESLAILFENDRIILPYDKSDPDTIAKIDQLVDELRAFPVGHTGDSAMAFWFAHTALRDLMKGSTGGGFLEMVQKDMEKIKDGQTQPPGLPGFVAMARNQRQ